MLVEAGGEAADAAVSELGGLFFRRQIANVIINSCIRWVVHLDCRRERTQGKRMDRLDRRLASSTRKARDNTNSNRR